MSAQYFLCELSHELRSPLNGIVGYTHLLSETKLNSTQKEYVKTINKCCLYLIELVNNILDFSRLIAGKSTLNNECFEIQTLIDDVDGIMDGKIKEKEQKLRYVVEKDVSKYIIADKQKLIQILVNLIGNANKFTDRNGHIIVTISLTGDKIEISINDNGIGIPRGKQGEIFSPFFQINDTTITSGCGLGLAISKKLVELLGGTIEFQSGEGEGSSFTFTFAFEKKIELVKFVETNPYVLKDIYVLLVDQNTGSRIRITEYLFDFYMNVVFCSEEREGLLILEKKRYDFLLILSTHSSDSLKNYGIPLITIGKKKADIIFENNSDDKIKLFDCIYRMVKKNNIEEYKLNEVESLSHTFKILIAEDISYSSDMLKKMLNTMGFLDITSVSNGEEAIACLDSEKYDVLLLDLKMPKKTGIEVAEHIKSKNYKIKTAVITSSVLEKDRETCKNLGIKYFLLKPFNVTHLKNVINKLTKNTL